MCIVRSEGFGMNSANFLRGNVDLGSEVDSPGNLDITLRARSWWRPSRRRSTGIGISYVWFDSGYSSCVSLLFGVCVASEVEETGFLFLVLVDACSCDSLWSLRLAFALFFALLSLAVFGVYVA